MTVNWLIENGKKLLGRTLAVVLIVFLLGAIVYYSPIGNVSPKPTFAFALVEGDQRQADSEYVKNASFLSRFFEMQFGLQNGSRIYAGGVGLHLPKGESWGGLKPEYHGGLNASVRDILVTLWSYRRAPPGTFGNQTGSWCVGSVANVSTTENVTIHASFATPTMTYMDTCTFIYGPEGCNTSSCGYWNLDPVWGRAITNCPWWEISSGELLRYLEVSGTTTITFDATFNVRVNYSIALGDETEIGETDLFWEGTLGTIEVKYGENSIFEIRYDFIRLEFVLLTLSEKTNP